MPCEPSRKPFCRTWTRPSTTPAGSRRTARKRRTLSRMPASGPCAFFRRFGTMTRARGYSRSCGTPGTAGSRAGRTWRRRHRWTAQRMNGPMSRSTPRNGCCSSTPSRSCAAALEQLPVDFREVIVLREIEGLSYKEIAAVVRVPIGTVMSRLARGRERLMAVLKLTAPMETLR